MSELSPVAKEVVEDLLNEYEGDLTAMAEDMYGTGICIECGATRGYVEPDAECYECEECSSASVYSVEMLALGGFL